MSRPLRSPQKHRRTSAADTAHALNNVLATIVLGVEVLRRGSHSPAEQSLFTVLEHAARDAEELGAQMIDLSASFPLEASLGNSETSTPPLESEFDGNAEGDFVSQRGDKAETHGDSDGVE
jgi:signal transduction histidine kinase